MTKRVTQRVNLFLDPGVLERAKAQAFKEGLPLSRFIEKVLNKAVPKTVEIRVSN